MLHYIDVIRIIENFMTVKEKHFFCVAFISRLMHKG